MKILLPADGSVYSEAAAGYLVRMGYGREDEVFVLHVMKDYLLPDELDSARDFRLAGVRGAESFVKDFRRRNLPAEFNVQTLVREGEPWQEIAACSGELGIDLVAMGHRGLSGIKRFMLGSTVHKVVRHSSVPVLVVRGVPPEGRPIRVLFCTDGTSSSDHARELLARLPLARDTVVTVISIVDMELKSLPEAYYPEEDISKMMAELRDHYAHSAQQAMDRDTTGLKTRFDDVRESIRFGVPDEEIINAASEGGADLVVMGCRELKGIAGTLIGSESLRVLKHIGCSMLIARSPLC